MEAFLGQKRAATPAEPSAALRAFFEVTSPAGTTAPSQQQGKCKGCGHQITMRSDRISHFAPNKTGAGSWSKYKMYRICSENMAEKNWRSGFVAKKRYQAVGFPCNRMLNLSSSRGIRIDVPVLSVSWSVVDHSVIIQGLKKDLSSARPVILEESLAGSPLVEIVWQRLQVTGQALITLERKITSGGKKRKLR